MQLGDWPIIGREEELALIVGVLVDHHRSIVIAGPPGVGKSRLAREAVGKAGADGGARYVTATRSAATTPLGALLGILDATGDGERGDASDRAALFRRASQQLRDAAQDGGRIVVGIDDAHLLDEVSAALVHQLAQQGDASLVVTVRSGETAPDAITALWRDELAERIELQPLARNDVHALLRATVPGADDEGTANRAWKATGGNPLYLRELVREAQRVGDLRLEGQAWAWDGRRVRVGARLRELMAGSLAGLAANERGVLDLLALGEPLPPGLFDATDIEAVRSCEQRGLVVLDRTATQPVLRLHHPMLGEVLRAELTDADRRRKSARLADLPGVAETDPLRAATWQVDAGRVPPTELLVTASTVALRSFDPALAARLAETAVSAGGGRPAILALAGALYAQERYADAEAVLAPLETSIDDEHELVDVGARMRAVTSAASSLTHAGRPADALALCDELRPVALAHASETPRDVGRVLAQRIHALVGLARLQEAHDTIAFIHGIAAAEGDDEVQGGAAMVLGALALEQGQVATAATWLREAATVLGRFDPQRNLPWCVALQAWAAALTGAVAEADAFATEAEMRARASPVQVWGVRIGLARAHAYAAAGELTRAGVLALETADRVEARGDRLSAAVALDAAVMFDASPSAVVDRLHELSRGTQIPWIDLWYDHARAVASGDGVALEAVADRFAELGARLRAAMAYQRAADEHERAGRRSSAVRARGRSQAHLKACDGVRLAPTGAGRGPVRLTRREREIATLAANGLTNQEIASRLSVGVRTVEGHLLRASTKLGVRRRGELAPALELPSEPA